MPNFINIKKLKELTNGIIKIKPLYNNISDNYTPTYRELKEGKFFNRFMDNRSPNLMVVGIKVNGEYTDCYAVDEKDVELIYPTLNEISIDPINNIPPCGIDLPLTATARFNIVNKNVLNEEVISHTKCCQINPFWRSSNPLFTINGTSLLADTNNQNKAIISTISASYVYSGISKNDSVIIQQEPNVIGDWEIESEETDSIQLSVTPDEIGKKGGQSKIRVIRHYTKNLIKQDSCGVIMETSATSCHMDDVTCLCQYENTNPEHFVRNLNIITVKKQDYNAKEQTAIITANFQDFTSSVTMVQEKGGEITYSYDLAFLDTDNTKLTKILDTSIQTTIKIPLISNKNMLIDGEYHSSIIYDNLTINNNYNWCKATIDDSGNDVVLVVNVLEPNHNRKEQRIANIFIANEEDGTKEIQLVLVQPNSMIIENVWEIYLSGGGEFTNETIKEAKITFKPIKKDIYEDGTWDIYDILDNDVKVTYKCKSTNPSILDGGILKRRNFNGLHEMKPKYVNNTEMNDVSLDIVGFIEDLSNNVLAESAPINITLNGVEVPSYTYELTFNDNNINNELIWEYNQLTNKTLHIKSLKNTYINGIKVKTEICDAKLKPTYEWGDDFFAILKGKEITAKPLFFNQTKDDIQNEYDIVQAESGKEIKLYLTQKPLIEKKEFQLTVKVHKDKIDYNMLIEEGASLTIIGKDEEVTKIMLSCGWLYPFIDDNSDIIYNGKVKLYEDMIYDGTIKNIIYSITNCDSDGNGTRVKYENQYYKINTNKDNIEIVFEL